MKDISINGQVLRFLKKQAAAGIIPNQGANKEGAAHVLGDRCCETCQQSVSWLKGICQAERMVHFT